MPILFKKKGGGLSRAEDRGTDKKPYPSVDKKDFAGGKRSYPIPTKADAVDALRLAGLHGRSDVKAKVYSKYPELKKKKEDGGPLGYSHLIKKKNNPNTIKYQSGGSTPYIYESADACSKDPKLQGIQTRGASGNTRCLGALNDVFLKQGINMRAITYPVLGKSPTQAGDTDQTVDSWNLLDVSRNTPDMTVIYDRERDGELTDEIINNLPLHAMIGTGDARGVYVNKENKNRVSRHTIGNVGFTKTGKSIIYDLGKYSEGVPDKYRKEINYIAVPTKDQVYFNQERKKTEPDVEPLTSKPGTIPNTEYTANTPITGEEEPRYVQTYTPSNYASDYMALLKSVFSSR